MSKASEGTDEGDESGSGSAAGYEEDDEVTKLLQVKRT